MILKSIENLNEGRGSSEKAISEFIESHYEVPWAHSSYLNHHLCKLVENGDIVVTSDGHYLIPNLNPEPKAKEQKRKGKGAVVEVKNQLGEKEKLRIQEMGQAQIYDEREEGLRIQPEIWKAPFDSGTPNNPGQYSEKQPVLPQSQPREEDGDAWVFLPLGPLEEKNQLGEEGRVAIKESSQWQRPGDHVMDETQEQVYEVNEGKSQSSPGQENACLKDGDYASLRMVKPVSPRVEDEEEEPPEELRNQTNRRRQPFETWIPIDSWTPINPQQLPLSQNQQEDKHAPSRRHPTKAF